LSITRLGRLLKNYQAWIKDNRRLISETGSVFKRGPGGPYPPRKCFGFFYSSSPLFVVSEYFEKSDQFHKTVETGVDPCYYERNKFGEISMK